MHVSRHSNTDGTQTTFVCSNLSCVNVLGPPALASAKKRILRILESVLLFDINQKVGSSVKMRVLGHFPNSLKSQIVRRSRFPSVSNLPAHAKNPSISFIPSLPFFVFPVCRIGVQTPPPSPFSGNLRFL